MYLVEQEAGTYTFGLGNTPRHSNLYPEDWIENQPLGHWRWPKINDKLVSRNN